jgi:hypothetical protein
MMQRCGRERRAAGQTGIDETEMNALPPRLNRNGTQIRAERTRVSVPASIVTMSAYQYPELADISRSGAKLSGDALPPKGTTALLRAGKMEVLCRVMWVKDGHCGIRFEEVVSPAVLKQLQLDGTMALEPVSPAAPRVANGETGESSLD